MMAVSCAGETFAQVYEGQLHSSSKIQVGGGEVQWEDGAQNPDAPAPKTS